MALVSGRFRLDPRAPAPERAIPPPPTLPKPAAAPPAAPRPIAPVAAASPAPTAKPRRKVLIVAAVVIGLLLVGGAVAVFVATSMGYPDAYTLSPSEYPSGMTTAPLRQSDRDNGLEDNPGPIDMDAMDPRVADRLETDDGDRPLAHGQILSAGGSRISILALKYGDAGAAQEAGENAKAICTFLSGAVMRDGAVLVVIMPESPNTSQVRAVANALDAKTPDLARVCGNAPS